MIDLQTNKELRPKFKSGCQHFCLQHKIIHVYLGLCHWKKVPNFVSIRSYPAYDGVDKSIIV